MSRIKFWLTGALLIGALIITATMGGQAQGSGGAFFPNFAYVIGGQWTWQNVGTNGLTPWVVRSSPTASAYTLTFTTPTANRTVTFPNATGTVVLGDSAGVGALRTGQVTLSGTNPRTVITGLSTITGCTATIMSSTNPNILTLNNISVIFTATAGRLDIYEWTTGNTASTGVVPVAYTCVGTV